MRTKEVGSMKKYSIIYADPPWAYRTYSKKGQGAVGRKPLSDDVH